MRLWLSVIALVASPAAAFASDPFAGKAVYETHCAACHGVKGVPPLAGVPAFARGERLHLPDMMLLGTVKNGKNMCPSQRHIVRDTDLLNALAYVRTLRR